jgi:probable H4MPT-linked C1 transfer pathway protein
VSGRAIGVDVGGANLKYASDDGANAFSKAFPMWRLWEHLASSLENDLGQFGEIDTLAVTMTGELADCFVDRQQGVGHIIQHVQEAARKLGVNNVHYYGVDGNFHSAAEAAQKVDVIAAANWHALAKYVATNIAKDAVLVDIGSTTTDIIPVSGGQVATKAQTDFDRLAGGSLIYVGCRRTPACALVQQLLYQGKSTAVMNELFATIDDARLILGRTPSEPSDTDSADGKPRTPQEALNRISRLIGLDRRSMAQDDAVSLANQIVDAARKRIADGFAKLEIDLSSVQLVLSGHGQDLLPDLPPGNTPLQLSEKLGDEISRVAPAFAVATLLASRT